MTSARRSPASANTARSSSVAKLSSTKAYRLCYIRGLEGLLIGLAQANTWTTDQGISLSLSRSPLTRSGSIMLTDQIAFWHRWRNGHVRLGVQGVVGPYGRCHDCWSRLTEKRPALPAVDVCRLCVAVDRLGAVVCPLSGAAARPPGAGDRDWPPTPIREEPNRIP